VSNPCADFRAELEEALAGPEQRRAALARHAHVATCASCRSELVREERLERLLAHAPTPEAPRELATNLLRRLEPTRGPAGDPGDELDEYLARVPAPIVPKELADRILTSLAPARRPRRAWAGRLVLLALAAAVLLAWILVARRARPEEIRAELARAAVELEADEELLVYALERWELLHEDDLDLWLASLDPLDECLMEVADEALWLDGMLDEAAAGEAR
jgi:hypothetical protein